MTEMTKTQKLASAYLQTRTAYDAVWELLEEHPSTELSDTHANLSCALHDIGNALASHAVLHRDGAVVVHDAGRADTSSPTCRPRPRTT
jgi:hypothetical protein